MNTNDLINRLGTDLAPVERLARPGRRAVLWLAGSGLYLAGMTLAIAVIVSSTAELDWSLVGSQLIGVVAAMLAAMAAFASVVPGYPRSALLAATVATVAWLTSFVTLAFRSSSGELLVTSQHEWICVAMILVGGAPLLAALAVMLRRGAPLNPLLTGLLAALAVALLANFSACLALPHSDLGAALVWHVGALAALVCVCVSGSRLVLNWRTSG